jgi:hypothetical protein
MDNNKLAFQLTNWIVLGLNLLGATILWFAFLEVTSTFLKIVLLSWIGITIALSGYNFSKNLKVIKLFSDFGKNTD